MLFQPVVKRVLHRAVRGVSLVEYTLVAVLLIVPVIAVTNGTELKDAIKNVFTGSIKSGSGSGTLEVSPFGE